MRKFGGRKVLPLIVLSERLQKKVQEKVSIPVALAMRYGSMTLKKGLQELVDKGCTEIKTIPLYPQFAMATTETIDVKVDELVAAYFPEGNHYAHHCFLS